MQPFTVKIFSGIFLQQSDSEHCNPIEILYPNIELKTRGICNGERDDVNDVVG